MISDDIDLCDLFKHRVVHVWVWFLSIDLVICTGNACLNLGFVNTDLAVCIDNACLNWGFVDTDSDLAICTDDSCLDFVVVDVKRTSPRLGVIFDTISVKAR